MTESAAVLLALAFVVMTLLGYFSVALVAAGRISNKLAWALAPAIGMGLCSMVFLLFRRPMFTVEFSLLALLFVVWLRYRLGGGVKAGSPTRIPALAGWMIGALVWVTFASFIWIDRGPYGDWDGWAIWSSHARYLYRAGPLWQEQILHSAHPDYPLLLPAATARLWRYIGTDVPEAVGVQIVMIGISGVLILAAALWELRKTSLSFLLPILLIGTPFYLTLGAWQYADVPLAVYILSTIALFCVHWEREPDRDRLLLLAGFTAGCAAFTKNEGLLFVVVTTGVMVLPIFQQGPKAIRRARMFLLGLLMPLAVTLYFKAEIGAPSDIVNNRAYPELLSKVLDVRRYMTIGSAVMHAAVSFGHWALAPWIFLIAFLAVWGVNRRSLQNGGWVTGAAAIGFMLAGYLAVYVITALPLEYHLVTSLDRLFIHLWPSTLLLLGLAVKASAT